MKAFPKATSSYMKRIFESRWCGHFSPDFIILFAAAFGKPVYVATSGFQKPFHDSTSSFQNPFKPIGIELDNTSCFR
jgi:hypothetical protein